MTDPKLSEAQVIKNNQIAVELPVMFNGLLGYLTETVDYPEDDTPMACLIILNNHINDHMQYISNAHRPDMIKALRGLADRLENNAPGTDVPFDQQSEEERNKFT